jgi:hypothetical protein
MVVIDYVSKTSGLTSNATLAARFYLLTMPAIFR